MTQTNKPELEIIKGYDKIRRIYCIERVPCIRGYTRQSVEALLKWHEDREKELKKGLSKLVVWYQERKEKGIDITPMQLAIEIDEVLGWQNK